MSKRILIIEDDEASRLMYTEILTVEDYSVVSKENGLEALDYLTANPLPHLIVMDLNFPAITPQEFIKRLKSNPNTSAIPYILVSGQKDLPKIMNELKAADHLQKPFDIDDFIEIIKKNS